MARKHPDGMVYLGQGLLKEWVLGRMKEQLKDVQVVCLDSITAIEEYHTFLVRIPSYTYKRNRNDFEKGKRVGAKEELEKILELIVNKEFEKIVFGNEIQTLNKNVFVKYVEKRLKELE